MNRWPRMMRVPVLGALGLLAACGGGGDQPGPGGVSVDEARALDDAAEMLDSQRLPPEALDDAGTDPAPQADSAGQ